MITGETISLRPLEHRHLEKTREWANNPDLMRLLNRALPVSNSEHERWFAALKDQKDRAYFAIETNAGSMHIGNIWLWDIDTRHHRAETRVVIGDALQMGRGIGSEAISLICDYGFRYLNLHKIYAYVLAINPRGRRAFEKAGFVLEGSLREDRWMENGYTDVYFLGKLRNEHG